jgi:hypothetical protein
MRLQMKKLLIRLKPIHWVIPLLGMGDAIIVLPMPTYSTSVYSDS